MSCELFYYHFLNIFSRVHHSLFDKVDSVDSKSRGVHISMRKNFQQIY